METNEIMTNEEVVETTEEIAKAGSGKGLKVAAGLGLAVVAGVFAYKYIARPVIAKIKVKKEAAKCVVDVEAEDIENDWNEVDSE